ncbi:mucin-20 [Myotis myotis]|uniref:Mucin 20, cell surface associated n=4 Tax=Myotis myotis TaxID=51298 RepID=A0A7J7ZZJ0_MYOMY|nr:mucin-20 [Myotis myotis]KAF6379469.1 mucin 20, cell surface associated [Myotis myotis]
MGSLWALALPLFFCCWEAGAPGSSAGANTQGPSPLVTMNHTEVPAVTLGFNTSLEGASETTDLAQAYVPSHTPLETLTLGTQTFDKTLLPASTISEAKIRETQTVSPATETRALTKITPSKSMSVITISVETSATSDSPSGTGMTTVETVTDSDLVEAVFDTLCTDDSSEEDERITMDALTWAHTSAEARALALESNSAPDITSQAQEPDITVPPKALVAYKITNIEATNCNIIEIEETAIIAGTSDVDHSPTGGKTPAIPETSALPDFTKAKSHLTRTTTPSEALSADSTTESVETPHTANSLTGETTAAKATAPSGTLVTASMNPLEETSAPSVETTSHAEVLGAVTISTEAGSTVGRATSSAESSAMGYSLSDVATIKESTRSETSTTDSTTRGPIPTSRGPLPSVHLAAANSSQETDITLAKTTASPKSSRIASMAGGKSPVATPITARTTGVTTGGDEGFLLLRLSVASPEDLTDPRAAERLMHQLRHELHAYLLPIQVSLLRVRRD